jgi:exopolyphosphatase/pppGpp-phosphohydrolase
MLAPRPKKMADIINLRRARKAKAKAQKESNADANRVLYGTSKSLRNLAQASKNKADQTLSNHRLEKPKDDN